MKQMVEDICAMQEESKKISYQYFHGMENRYFLDTRIFISLLMKLLNSINIFI